MSDKERKFRTFDSYRAFLEKSLQNLNEIQSSGPAPILYPQQNTASTVKNSTTTPASGKNKSK